MSNEWVLVGSKKEKKHRVKTILCKHYLETGMCSYGNNCTYAHGEKELTICKFGLQCNNSNCKFYHSNIEDIISNTKLSDTEKINLIKQILEKNNIENHYKLQMIKYIIHDKS